MKDQILLLYFRDERYGKRLLRYLAGKKNPLLRLELVTAEDRLAKRVASESGEVAILTDCAGMQQDEGKKVIVLSAEADKGKRKLFQYQKASGIYRDLLEILRLEPVEGISTAGESAQREKGVFCLLDPEGGGGTALAVLLAQYLGRQGKCLYLNLGGFPLYYGGVLQEEPNFAVRGLGELFFRMEEDGFAERVAELARPFGRAQMLAPFPHFKDLLDCGAGEWKYFLQRLQTECGYDTVVVETGQIFEYMLDLMSQAGRCFLLESPGICGRIRTAVFRRYCRLEQKEELIQSCHVARLPFSAEEGREILARQTPQEIGEDRARMTQIGSWLEQSGREEEDDVIIEEDE